MTDSVTSFVKDRFSKKENSSTCKCGLLCVTEVVCATGMLYKLVNTLGRLMR